MTDPRHEKPLAVGRREFLAAGLGALVAGAAGTTGLGAGEPAGPGSGPGSGPPPTPVLTPDGRLVQGDASRPLEPRRDAPEPGVREGIPGRRWIMAIDLARCDGCGKCSESCAKMHFIPPQREWIRVYRMQDAPSTVPYWFPKPCFHCDNPPCTKVCPVNATFKRRDGIVLIDNERCIGCRFCMAACPYSTRVFNWDRPRDPADARATPYSPEHGFPRRIGTVEKCDFCPDMAARGELPGCAAGCPMGAIYFGDQNEDAVTNSKGETERLSRLLRDRAGYRYMEDLGTEPRVYYLPPKNRLYPIPEAPPRHEPKPAGEHSHG